jgi:hypothetical protein
VGGILTTVTTHTMPVEQAYISSVRSARSSATCYFITDSCNLVHVNPLTPLCIAVPYVYIVYSLKRVYIYEYKTVCWVGLS